MKILLVCAQGMSTSILVDKIKQVAKSRNIDLEITAKANNAIHKEVGLWDICLLGPQVRFALKTIQSTLNIPTELIDAKLYAFADAEKILDQAIGLYNKSEK